MSDISRTAKSMEYAFDGISDKFPFQRNMPDANMLARARAFVIEAVAYNADFIAYGLPATFAADLTAAAVAFEWTFTATASAAAEHVDATADTSAKMREGMVIVRISTERSKTNTPTTPANSRHGFQQAMSKKHQRKRKCHQRHKNGGDI